MTKILVVEDESIVGLDIQNRLQRFGFEVSDVVASGEEAITSSAEMTPDLVLMDIMLQGDMDGVEAADLIRARHDIPVIFLTAYSDEGTLERAKTTNPHGYVLKPFEDRELYTTIQVVLGRHESDRELKKLHDELEVRVQERTAELARVNTELRREIEERKRADEQKVRLAEQLRQSQKMESLGRLAAGVAHDFNNMLTIINGYSALALDNVDPDDPLHQDIETIKDAGERASLLTEQLLAFGRRQLLDIQRFDIHRAMGGTFQMLQRLIGEDIQLIIDLQPGVYCVETDPGQFDQVLFNLAINARDAMLGGGQLFIETAVVELDEKYARCHVDVAPGPYVRIRVRDTGCGMSQDLLSRVFEPFFTTKPKGKGTGLGLSVVYGIVEQSGGHIDIASQPDRGTTVDLYLPRVAGAPEAPSPRQAPATLQGDRENILLVEDEEVVRDLAHRVLRDHGYSVLEARGGEEALVLCELHDGPIHLLLTDVVMPEMSGPQLAERLVPLRPDMKVIFMSGYTDDKILQYGISEEEMSFLQKPFTPAHLAAKVRQALTG